MIKVDNPIIRQLKYINIFKLTCYRYAAILAGLYSIEVHKVVALLYKI